MPRSWRADVGFFAPGTAMASEAGMSAITGPRDPDRARREILQAGYAGEPVVVMTPATTRGSTPLPMSLPTC